MKRRGEEKIMLTRREMMKSLGIGSTLFAAGLIGAVAQAAETHNAAHESAGGKGVTVKKLFDYPLEELPGHNAVVVRVDLAPGASSPPHHHPGSVIGYVLSGTVRIKIDPDAVSDYKRGELWYEPPKAVHRVTANLSKTAPAAILAFMIVPHGEPLTTPEKSEKKPK
jgi:quercetin dioxygenase-like cupin family protein